MSAKRNALLACLFVAIGSSLLPRTACAHDEALATKLSEEWTRYQKGFAAYQGKSVTAFRNLVTGETAKEEKRSEYRQQGAWRLFLFERQGRDGPSGKCRAINSKYTFELARGKGGWRVKEIDFSEAEQSTIWFIKKNMAQNEEFAAGFSPFSLVGHGLVWDLAKRPGFTVTKQETIANDGGLEKIWFTAAPDAVTAIQKGSAPIDGDGWIIFDPLHYWSAQEFELPFNSPGVGSPFKANGKFYYDKGPGDLPLLKKAELT